MTQLNRTHATHARTDRDDDLARAIRRLGGEPDDFRRRVRRLIDADAPRYRRMWSYYRNPARLAVASASSESDPSVPAAVAAASSVARPYRQAQEWGLPRRITGGSAIDPTTGDPAAVARREVVIENDIGWRVDAMVDFLFGRAVAIRSTAPDPARREFISALLRAVIGHAGGAAFFQQLAVVGAVFGHVDVLVKLLPDDEPVPTSTSASPEPAPRDDDDGGSHPSSSVPASTDPDAPPTDASAIARLARRIRLEVVEPARALPLLDPLNPQVVRAYALVDCVDRAIASDDTTPRRSWWKKFLPSACGVANETTSNRVTVIHLVTPTSWMTFHEGKLVGEGRNTLGVIPLAHVQNVAAPFQYAGAGDVEPLMPLQDELNTRLSDRAHRITMQSFRMYLGKGIEQFTDQPVAPGRMWMTDNPDAQIVEFGGDAACPSEDAHVREVREAMDKTSGVTPIAAGILKNRIGRLTSGAALRVTMLALLARTDRKRLTYGAGIARICELALAWLDHARLFATAPEERQVTIDWPDPVAFIDSTTTPRCEP